MPENMEDTRPKRPAMTIPPEPMPMPYDDGVSGPPRLLFFAVIGLFLLGVFGVVGSVVAFRFVLEPAQQVAIIDRLPFMEAFLPPRPPADATLPTPEGMTNDVSADALLADILGDVIAATETPQPTPTAAPPTPTPTPDHTPTPEPTVETAAPPQAADALPVATTQAPVTVAQVASQPPLPPSARMTGFVHQQQTWNNCGPANITMALSYYGWQNDQAYAMRFLRPGGREDKNVSPSELVDFVNTRTAVRALTRMGGTLDLLKRFIANEIPVIVETGFMPEGYDWLGHYRTLVAYDDARGVFWIYDSFLGTGANGEGVAETYTQLDRNWQEFNRQFIIVYEPQREELVRSILGEYADRQRAAEIALETALAEAEANRTNPYAWFNVGSSLVALADYERAANAYALALREGLPWRIIFYQFGIYEAYYHTGRHQELLSLVDSSLANGGNYVEETYYWQGMAFKALGRTADARTAFNRSIQRNPSYQAPRDALATLN